MPLRYLVTDDRAWAADFFGRPVQPGDPLVDSAAARAELERDGEAPRFIHLSADPAAEALLLLQTLELRRLPAPIYLITEAGGADERLARLEETGRQVLIWPRDRLRLLALWNDLAPSTPARPTTGIEIIQRRLRCWTPSLLPLAERLALAAEHDVTVLLTGETGVGKSYLAQLLHEQSPRRAERFLTVACGAITPSLIESEFFGHVKGAFTGADRAKIGKFEAAGAGTLLLDEIDALSLEQQANLLRIVESGEFEPVGETQTQKIRCRVVVTSNRDLGREAAAGRFREDLYYRLNVMQFDLAPLRERPMDVPWLIQGLAARYATRFKKPLRALAPETLALLLSHPWPGNLRQLENVLQAAVLVCPGPVLFPEHLPDTLRLAHDRRAQGPAIPPVPPRGGDSLSQNRATTERAVILRALAQHGYSRIDAARALGISRVTLYKKMKKYRLFEREPIALGS
jgi:two-component system response regulator HydG